MKKILIIIVLIAVAGAGYMWWPELKGMYQGEEVVSQGKLNIDEICQNALISRTFPSSVEADQFVADCKEGKYPEVIEEFKNNLNLGEGAEI